MNLSGVCGISQAFTGQRQNITPSFSLGSISRKGSFVFVSHAGLMPKAIKFRGEYFLRRENNSFQNMGRIMKQTNKKTGSFFLVKSFA